MAPVLRLYNFSVAVQFHSQIHDRTRMAAAIAPEISLR